MTSPDVIVVGGGVAGLSAATALAAAGARVCVVEARGMLGGRTSSFADRRTGTIVDNGQHIVLGCYRETWAYLDRIGARDGITLQPALEMTVVDRAGGQSTLRCPAWPSPWHLVGGLARWGALGWRDRFAAARLAPHLLSARRVASGVTPMPAALERETVAEWLARHGQTARLIDLLWEPLALGALNQPIATALAAPFVRVLGRVFGPDPRDAAIGWPGRPLAAVFADPAVAFLEARGGRVQRHAPARLVVEHGRACGVEVRGARLSAATIVCAVPWWAWRNFVGEDLAASAGLSSLRADAIRRRSSPIVTVNLWPDREVLGLPFLGLPGRVFQWVFERPGGLAGSPAGGAYLSAVSSGADETVDDAEERLVTRAWAELRDAVPGARAATVRHASVVRERRATFCLAGGEPARPPMQTPLDGLWLAGDWTDTGLPATIEGAILSGHRVARALLGASGAPDQPSRDERAAREGVSHP